MPNIPSSSAQTPAKKRKLTVVSSSSAVPINIASIEVLPIQPNPNGSGTQTGIQAELPQQSVSNGSGDQMISEKADVDDKTLNSEVYQIYCRHKDPKEAMKEIGRLKSCWKVVLAKKPFPSEENFKNMCEIALDRLWKLEPRLGDSKFERIKKFINRDITLSELSNSNDEVDITTLFDECMSWISIFLPNGYEFWYIANFEQGPGKSKWYRGESSKPEQSFKLARLNVLGITNSTISKLHYDHYLAKNSTKVEWLDFAKESLRWKCTDCLFDAPEGCVKGMLSDMVL